MDKNWFYSKDGKLQEGPVTTDELCELIASGTLTADILLWAEGMPDWAPASSIPELGLAAPVAQQPIAKAPSGVPDGLASWMGFVGVMTIIGGVFQVCNLFIGVPMIIAGVALMGARTALDSIKEIDPPVAVFMAKIKTCVVATGIFYILTLAMVILVLILYAVMGVAIFSAATSGL